jgi:hypothetical protein
MFMSELYRRGRARGYQRRTVMDLEDNVPSTPASRWPAGDGIKRIGSMKAGWLA